MPKIAYRVLILLSILCSARPAMADDEDNHKKLAAMPRERRVALSENLEKFDKLDSAQQAEIRRLDAELAKKEPDVQARYRTVLRSYHLWVAGLSLEKQEKLRNAKSDEERFNLATKFRADDKEIANKPLPRVMGVRTGDFGVMGPFEAAHLLNVWHKLSPDRQAAISRISGRAQVLAAIRKEGQTASIHGPSFPSADETSFGDKFLNDPEFNGLLKPLADRVNAQHKSVVEEQEKAAKKGAGKKASPPRKFEHPYAEFLYFENHPPHLVLHKNYERFVAAAPPWFFEVLDPMGPDDARYYVSIVYRILYLEPKEMPEPLKEKPEAGKPGQSPKASKKGTARPGID